MSHINLADWLRKLDLFGKNRGREEFHLKLTLEHLRHLLPNQGPIKDFIHHNPLHGFQSLDFHEGVDLAASLFGSKKYLSPNFYKTEFDKGRITASQLDFVSQFLTTFPIEKEEIHKNLQSMSSPHEQRYPSVSEWGIRQFWNSAYQIEVSVEAATILFKVLSSYLDQGISFWPFPSRKDSFWLSLRSINNHSSLPLMPFERKKIRQWLDKNPEEALSSSLEKLTGDKQLFSRYLIETVLTYPGWAGMVCALETNPSTLRKPVSLSLLDLEYQHIHRFCSRVKQTLIYSQE